MLCKPACCHCSSTQAAAMSDQHCNLKGLTLPHIKAAAALSACVYACSKLKVESGAQRCVGHQASNVRLTHPA